MIIQATMTPISWRQRVVLGVLVACYAVNIVDRAIMTTMSQAIKVGLNLTDAELGLVGGSAFAVLYTFAALPIARLAERFNRVSIIATCMVLWSGFTTLCGFAGGFAQLALLRVGVGLGEAGLTPAAHSIIADYFEPRRRATALSVYSCGLPIGLIVGGILGGLLARDFGWRVGFVVAGLPGIVVALLAKVLIREPVRGASETAAVEGFVAEVVPIQPFSREWTEISAVCKSLFFNWPIANLVLGMVLVSFAGFGAAQFLAPYFLRTFHLDYLAVGLIIGLVGGISEGVGLVAGGLTTDWAGQRNNVWYAIVPAIGGMVAAPLFVAALSASDWKIAACLLLVAGTLSHTWLGPTFSVIHNAIGIRRRATATALVFLVANLIGQGFAPPFVGWMIDRLGQSHLLHPEPTELIHRLLCMFEAVPDAALHYSKTCRPDALKVAGSVLSSSCRSAQVAATREAISVNYGFVLWGALHFFLASFGLTTHLEKARQRRQGSIG
jgi:MFS family permease